jgi:hypothetical protein
MRTFCRFRASLLNRLDLDRHAIRPGTPLESLLPEPERSRAWEELRRQGLRLPALELSTRDQQRILIQALRATVSWAVSLQNWLALALFFPLIFILYRLNRHRAVHFPLGLKTVGELVIYMTCFREHKDSGYRWTRNEIELKVRFTIAESVGCDVDDIRPETTFAELAAMG